MRDARNGGSSTPVWQTSRTSNPHAFHCDADGVPDMIVGSGADGFLDASGDLFRIVSGVDGSTIHEIEQFDPSSERKSIGWSVAGLGDVNGDGHADVAVGQPLAYTGFNQTGKVFVYSGADLSVLHVFAGIGGSVQLGWRVANAGDVEGDGIADVACACHRADKYAAVLSGATGALLLTIPGLPGAVAGDDLDVAGLGDIDGDGRSDLVLSRNGAAFLYSGADGRLLLALDDLPGGGFGGTLSVPWAHWPTGLPGFTPLWFQVWAADTTAPAGASASNALLAMTP